MTRVQVHFELDGIRGRETYEFDPIDGWETAMAYGRLDRDLFEVARLLTLECGCCLQSDAVKILRAEVA